MSPIQGWYNSHFLADSGTIMNADCGNATYTIQKLTPPEPIAPPPPLPTTDTRYEIRVHQEMELDYLQFIVWELWGFHNGFHLQGPSRALYIKNTSTPVIIEVDEPLNKDDTNVKFSYRHGAFPTIEMTMGTTRKHYLDRIKLPSKQYWPNHCDAFVPEAEWRPKTRDSKEISSVGSMTYHAKDLSVSDRMDSWTTLKVRIRIAGDSWIWPMAQGDGVDESEAKS
jgi:hypothetical protein